MDLVAWGKWAMGTTTVHVCKVGMGGGIVVVGGQRAALTTKTKEGRGSREGGVGLEPVSTLSLLNLFITKIPDL